MPFHVRLVLLLAVLGDKIIKLSDKLKQYECKRITKRSIARNKARRDIDKEAYEAQRLAYKVSRVRHRELDEDDDADNTLYTLLKGEA